MEKAYTMPRSWWRHDGRTRLGAMKNILIVVAVGLVGLAAADKKIQMKDLPQPVQKAV
jgi:hypothetical protein